MNWTRTLDAYYLLGMDVDSSGQVALIGLTYDGAVDLAPGSPAGDVQGSLFLSLNRENGNFRWGGGLEALGFSSAATVAFGDRDALYYSAQMSGTADVDPTPGVVEIFSTRQFAGVGRLRVR